MSPPIYTPDGSEVTEIVLPDGSTASEVVAPDGSVVFDAGPDIPDSVVAQYDAREEASVGDISTIDDLIGSFGLSGSASVIESGIDGQQTYRFNGSETMEHDQTIATDDPFAFVFVAQQQEPADSNSAYMDGGTGLEFAPADQGGTGTGASVYRGGPLITNTGFVFDQQPHINVVEAINGNEVRWEQDGTNIVSGTASSSDLTGLTVGGFRTSPSLEVDFGQIEVLEGYTQSELNAVRDRIANDWDITI